MHINDPDIYTEVELLISTPELEIVNYDKSVTSISKEEEAEIFLEVSTSMQDINEVIEMFLEEKDVEVLRKAEIRPKR